MIIPANKQPRWIAWLTAFGIVVSVILMLSIGVYRLINSSPISPASVALQTTITNVLQPVLPAWMLPIRSTPPSTPITPQKTSEYIRGAYVNHDSDTIEVKGTGGSIEKIKIGDRTEFTCAPRYIRDASGAMVDTMNILLVVKPGSNYTFRSSAPSFVGRSMFEGTVKPDDILLVTLDTAEDEPAIRVSLITDPCDPERWKL